MLMQQQGHKIDQRKVTCC